MSTSSAPSTTWWLVTAKRLGASIKAPVPLIQPLPGTQHNTQMFDCSDQEHTSSEDIDSDVWICDDEEGDQTVEVAKECKSKADNVVEDCLNDAATKAIAVSAATAAAAPMMSRK